MDGGPHGDEEAELADIDQQVAYVEALARTRSFTCPACGEPTIPGEPVNYAWDPADMDHPQVYHAFCDGP